MELIILSGMSGAGKTAAMIALEDVGFFCVDNVPPQLIGKFIELHVSAKDFVKKMALIVDSRSFVEAEDFLEIIKLLENNIAYKLIFLDASDSVLLNRYKENRRNHPLFRTKEYSIKEAIEKERELLAPIKVLAEYLIDTTAMTTKELKNNMAKIVNSSSNNKMLVQFMSFGFKHGMPLEPDLVFDVRCLPNPFYVDELKNQTGLDKPVQAFVMESDSSKGFYNRILDLVNYTLPLYEKEGKTRLVVAFGCTGGKHRSVTFAEKMYEYFLDKDINAIVTHRDKDKKIQ